MGKYKWSERSIKRLLTCHSALIGLANAMLDAGEMDLTILEGHRGEKAQNAAFRQGFSKLQYPKSKHNKQPSLAMDIAPYPLDWNDTPRWQAMVALAKRCAQQLGMQITCGGDWKMRDFPHIQFEGLAEHVSESEPEPIPNRPEVVTALWQDEIELEYGTIAINVGKAHSIPPRLILAIIQVESGGVATAWRPEPRYPYLLSCRTGKPFRRLSAAEARSATPPSDFPFFAGSAQQEWSAQRASWGLMQIMGANARWLGCQEPYLTALVSPIRNVGLGARLLRWYADRALERHGWEGVCMAYNGGMGALKTKHNTAYAAKVLAALGGAWPEVSPWMP